MRRDRLFCVRIFRRLCLPLLLCVCMLGTEAASFRDVPAKYWAAEDIDWANREALMLGTSDDTFSPELSLTRAMFVTILCRFSQRYGIDTASGQASPFKDVPQTKNTWYRDAVLWAYRKGIVQGMNDGTFAPDLAVTREQMAAMTVRYLDCYFPSDKKTEAPLPFSDASRISPYARTGVSRLVAAGILQGDDTGRFRPQAGTARAAAAAVFHRLDRYLASLPRECTHRFTTISVRESTCTEAGEAVRKCEICGGTVTVTLPATGHVLTRHEGREPTCTAGGWAPYETCDLCSYSTRATLPATGHRPGTPIGDGYTLCTVCKTRLSAPGTDARLSVLTASGVTLTPSFSPEKFSYRGTAPASAAKLTLNCVPREAGAAVRISGASALQSGTNRITVTVTAKDGVTKTEYVLTVEKPGVWPRTYDGSYGLDITNRKDLVSICYSTWHDYTTTRPGFRQKTISELERTGAWSGDASTFYFWGKPALGYYKSTDRTVIRRHMTQLSEAGIDFIIIDNTNASLLWQSVVLHEIPGAPCQWQVMISYPVKALMDECLAMREEGLTTPYIVFWNRGQSDDGTNWTVTKAIYEDFFLREEYKDLFVYWNGKPLFLTTGVTAGAPYPMTVRKMWGLISPASNEWTFLQKNNGIKGSSNEQMCVCTAAQQTYMSVSTALGRRGGLTFYEQWSRAFAARPKIVTVSWWNEWAAQRQTNGQFVDNYNTEYSRDIEPMAGGHGDAYYRFMKEYIRAYKAHLPCPKLLEP